MVLYMEAHKMLIGYCRTDSSWFGADQSYHLGVVKALEMKDLGLDEAGSDRLQMSWKLLEEVPS